MKNLLNVKQLTLTALLVAGGSVHLPAMASSSKVATIQTLKLRGNHGAIGVLASGLALYSFDPDNGSEKPACNAVCAEKWPPVIIEDDSDIKDDARLGMIERATGLKQLTIDGKPVYTFFMDRLAGDTKGDGLGGVWHLIEM